MQYAIKRNKDGYYLAAAGGWNILAHAAKADDLQIAAAWFIGLTREESRDCRIVRIRKVPKKTIPVPKIETDRGGHDLLSLLYVNGVDVLCGGITFAQANIIANLLCKALGMPEEGT